MAQGKLQIHADDLGMSMPINEGIFRAFDAGVLDSVSIMPPAPAFEEAAQGVRERALPCAVHLTLASEWNNLRWGPLTGAPSLRATDGCFPLHVRDLDGRARLAEVEAELVAQVERVIDAGIQPTHLDAHVALFDSALQGLVCDRFGLKSRDTIKKRPDLALGFSRLVHLTPRTLQEKKALLAKLRLHTQHAPGHVLLVTHPAVRTPELDSMCIGMPGFEDRLRWAVDYRVSDFIALLD